MKNVSIADLVNLLNKLSQTYGSVLLNTDCARMLVPG